MRPVPTLALLLLVVTLSSCSTPEPAPMTTTTPPSVATSLDAKIARFAPVDIAASIEALPRGEAAALQHIVKAAEVMDSLFLEQVWEGNPALLQKISQDTTPEGRSRRHYFTINKGPWSRLDHNEGFLPAEFGVPPKPPQANYYPADATKEEVDKWIASLKGDAHAQATSFFTVIRRAGWQADGCAVQRGVSGQGEAGRRPPAPGGGAHHTANAQEVPPAARRRVPLE